MKKLFEIRDIYSDLHDLTSWTPLRPVDLNIKLVVEVGWKNEVGINYFYFDLIGCEAALNQVDRYFLTGHGIFLIPHFDFSSVKMHVSELVVSCQRGSFDESCLALSKHFRWEYDEYQSD
jgi:hypothetical protein